MIDINALVTGMVALLQTIPELVEEMNGDIGRINAYTYRYPEQMSLEEAVTDLTTPDLLVAHTSTSPGSDGDIPCWRHEVTVFVRAKAKDASQPPAYWNIHRLLWKGIPGDSGAPMGQTEIIPDCYAMEMPAMMRQQDSSGLDYFSIQTAFNEKGDD